MIIQGSAVFKCPKTKKDVRLDRECLDADGKGSRCIFFKHWMWTEAHPTICCNYKQEQETENTESEEVTEEEETETGKEWRQPQFIE